MERQLHFILGLRLWGEEGRGTKNFLAASLRNTQLPCGKEEKRSRQKEGLGSWGRVGEEGEGGMYGKSKHGNLYYLM